MEILLGVLLLNYANAVLSIKAAERTTQYWNYVAEAELNRAIRAFDSLNTNKAKNIILLVGDGMSLSTVTAGRIAMGQKLKKDGEEYVTSLDRMPHSGLLKTYSVDDQTPDSASTATAFLSGVKTNSGQLGVNAKGSRCSTISANKVKSLLEYAVEAGKSTGIVTTNRIQDATPAAAYAHAHHRLFYSDKDHPSHDRCPDISTQLFNKRRDIQVVLGGGRAHMTPTFARDPEDLSVFGERRDNRNLIKEWLKDLNREHVARYVWNKAEFDAVNPWKTDYLLGLFNPFDTEFAARKKYGRAKEPSLARMTKKAIRILSKNSKGFFLLVESGLIDKAHHKGRARSALEEFAELDRALRVSRSLTEENDTLIIVSSDHGHMFMLGGTSKRGHNIYGLATSQTSPERARDDKFYTSILYGNGPGYIERRRALPLTDTIVTKWGYRQQSAVPLNLGTHSAEDVIVLGSGPMSHLLTGVHEQTHIASVARYAACLGSKYDNEPHCRSNLNQTTTRGR